MVKIDSTRLAELCRQHGVKRLRVFGSTARGDDRPDSDVDLIADFGSPTGLFALIRFEKALSVLFGRPVDLVTEPGLSPYMRDSILSSAAVLFDDAA
ncbi:MAG: nucleotidyltransferase family protein [Gemmatimonadetes bacterium]|nr:nucleotidyltransferase family protein [Gemmatimonadota bacterium]